MTFGTIGYQPGWIEHAVCSHQGCAVATCQVYGCECGPEDSRQHGAAGAIVDRMGMLLLTPRLQKRQLTSDGMVGQQVLSGTHPADQGRGGAQARDVLAGLCGCVCDAGAEHEYDGDADPGRCWADCAERVSRFSLVGAGSGRVRVRQLVVLPCSILLNLRLFQCSHDFFHLLWTRDAPNAPSLDRAFHAHFFSDQIPTDLARPDANISSDLFLLMQILDALPPLYRLHAAPREQVLQLLLVLKRLSAHI
jgi:hypothetical protein